MNAADMSMLLKRLQLSAFAVDEQAYQTALEFINSNPTQMFNRKNMNGHFSASGYAFQNGRIWFIKHPYLHTILLPAGHMEIGETPLQTAQREYLEETGFTTHAVNDSLIGLRDLKIIQIPANPLKSEGAHIHIDLRYELTITSQPRNHPELPTFLIARNESPGEFHKYFDYKIKRH